MEIFKSFDELKKSCADCSDEDLLQLERAFNYAWEIFGEQAHETGELKIIQSLNVAKIVSGEIGLRSVSVVAALLHDVIDSPNENLMEVEKNFGTDVSKIIRGFKRISGLHSDKVSLQSENFRNLYLNTVEDIRIIFIKMAHRLYDMRIYNKLPPKLKTWFLDDIRYLYIPIAHRLGLYQIKAELEDFELKYSEPEAYNQIASKLNESRAEQDKYIQKFINPIRKILSQERIQFEIKSRAKTISSIKRKLQKQEVDLDQIYDLFAIRVILTGVLTDEEYLFVEDFQRFMVEKGDPRNSRKSRKDKQSEDESKDSETEYFEELKIEKEIQFEEVKSFEEKRKNYLRLMQAEKTECWHAYSLITNIYTPNPKRLRDWISAPKASGYESLHTTVLGPEGRYVEVQIRTRRMDDHAEKGAAAHWRYKESAYGKDLNSWMNDIRNVLDNMGAGKLDDGETSKIHSDSDKIYVFTPNGDLRELRQGATVLDFAFDIHSNLGCTCTGGKINDKVVPIRHVLQNGDKVEISTSKKQKPNLDWLKYVVTSKAKSRINRALREEKFQEAQAGKETLMRKFKNWKIEFNDANINKVTRHYSFKKHVDLFFNIAVGKIDVLNIKQLFQASEDIEEKLENNLANFELTEALIESQSEKDHGYILIEAGVSNLSYSLSKCCNPIAGDKIFGFVTVNSGIKIHRYDCPNAAQLLEKYPYRIIKSRWKESKSTQFFNTNLRLIGRDRMGLLNDITKVISNDLKVNMKDFNFKTEGDSFEGLIKLQIRDAEHLGFLKQKLLKIKGITRVVRFE
ncbi:MAG: HD domain-containing protein [Bacteroidales bacterium]|nr:HD domain-containing protein [Bacteroidales bacterium]